MSRIESRALLPAIEIRNAGTFSRSLSRLPRLVSFLGAERVHYAPTGKVRELDAMVGWGHKSTAKSTRAFAERHHLPYVRLEDGFLRSVDRGSTGAPPLSLVVDDVGVYYDARQPSRLENLLQGDESRIDPLADAELLRRADACIEVIVREGLSKYNDTPVSPSLARARLPREYVLVVDQVGADSSIEGGLASAATFQQMLEEALRSFPDLPVVVKAHPEVGSGKRQGHFAKPLPARALLFSEPINAQELLEGARHVFVCSSQLGFEALLAGKPVTCFGAGFYSGWGLTDDRVKVPRRTRRRSVRELVAAALLVYSRYVDPETGEACQAERVIEHLVLQRARFRQNRGNWYCFGFSGWKRHFIRRYLRSPGHRVHFVANAREARRLGVGAGCRLLVWGSRDTDALRELSREFALPIERMEDGVVRSVGLGSDLHSPTSLVRDPLGIYYDPSRPSQLERWLETRPFSTLERECGASLRAALVASKLSKYNFGSPAVSLRPQGALRVAFVPGQVEDDASILLGSPSVSTNEALLRAVRRSCPDAFILYKPHPDVVSGNRQGALSRALQAELCDAVTLDAPIPSCLEAADEVHTMTSLVGFEALLRGLPVSTYGTPFYAGWGLTVDALTSARRTRKLHLDELVFAMLVLYPTYYNYEADCFTTAEQAMGALVRRQASRPLAGRLLLPSPVRQALRLGRLLHGVWRAH